MTPQLFITWTCAVIFACTGILTIIGLVKKGFIPDRFLNKLFLALILEIIAVSIFAYKSSFVMKEHVWTIHSDIHFLDEKGNKITGDLRVPFKDTKPIILPRQIEEETYIPYEISYKYRGDINKISLYYTCDDSAGWNPAKINDLSGNSNDIVIDKRDDNKKELYLTVNISKIEKTQKSGEQIGLHPSSGGPPVQKFVQDDGGAPESLHD